MIKIACGLGNPGESYRGTRHNLGFEIIDRLVGRHESTRIETHRLFYSLAIDTADGILYLIKPQTYMNRSGLAVADALRLWNARPDMLFVISDDFNLSLGKIRIRKSGSAGGHKGLASIIDCLGTDSFPRLRLGVGPLPEEAEKQNERITDFVLSRFPQEEVKIVDNMILRAVEAVDFVLNNRLDMAISKYNSANPTPGS